MSSDQVAQLMTSVAAVLQSNAALGAQMVDVLRRLDKIEAALGSPDQDVLRRLTAIEDAQTAAEKKRDEAREESRAAHDAVLARVGELEDAFAAAASEQRGRAAIGRGVALLVGAVGGVAGAVVSVLAITDRL